MKIILEEIADWKLKLEKSDLCQWLHSDEQPQEDRFCFLPAMTFLVMGFKDILGYARVTHPTSDLDHHLNTHCTEDSEHWKWFLGDIERLGFSAQSWGGGVPQILARIWSDENRNIRNLVYRCIHHIEKHDDPRVSLVVIEVLEAAFAAYIRHMRVQVERAGLYDRLDYYGRTHIEKEEAHSMGSWTNGQASLSVDLERIQLEDNLRRDCLSIVDELFISFETIWNEWYQHRNDKQRYPRTLPLPLQPDAEACLQP